MTAGYAPTGMGTAAGLYGSPAPPQPAPAGGTSSDAALSTGARTAQPASELPIIHRAAFWLVVLVAVAIGLIRFSIRVG